MRHGGDVFDEDRFNLAGNAQRTRQRTAIGGDDGRFAGGVDLGEQYGIGGGEHLDEVLEAVARAGVAMRLEGQHDAPSRECTACGRKRGRHLGRVVTVVVDQGEVAPVCQWNLAVALEAPPDAVELGKGFLDCRIASADFRGYRDGGQRIADVVFAWQVQRDREARNGTVAAHAIEMHPPRAIAAGAHVFGANVGPGVNAVGDDLFGELRKNLAHVRVVAAHHRDAVEGQAMDEIDEGLLEPTQVVAVGVHVVLVDVRHDRDHRRQEQEGGVRFVGFGDEKLAETQAGVGAGRVESAADDEGRVEPGFGQATGGQAGGGGLAMGAGDSDALLEAHQFSQHLGAWHDRNVSCACGGHFRVVFFHGGRNHHGIGIDNVFGAMADGHADAFFAQTKRGRRGGQVGAADRETLVGEHLGDARHAGAANPDEVNAFDFVFHDLFPASGRLKNGYFMFCILRNRLRQP